MKALRIIFSLAASFPGWVLAQNATAPIAGDVTTALRSQAELDQLLGPIALYPDAIIALILPASTAPADIVLAARQMQATNNDLSQVELRAWDESVKSLTHYPDLLKWLDDNLEWTKQVGQAFFAQPADVMNAIQRLRRQARAGGSLVDSPQQQILVTPDVIRIVPAQPDVIYIPQYEPSVVYVDRQAFYPLPPLAWGVGVPVGSWLAFDCDWVNRKVWVGDRHRHWQGQDWKRPIASPDRPAGGTVVRQWQPSHSALDRSMVGPLPAISLPQRGTPPARGNDLPRAPRPARDFNGPRTIVVNPASVVGPQALTAAPGTPSRERSLPNIIGRSQLPVAPALPATITPLPTAREGSARSFPGPTAATTLSVAPSLPNVAPPLPATVPTFVDPAPASRTDRTDNNSPAAPDRPAPINPRTGGRLRDN